MIVYKVIDIYRNSPYTRFRWEDKYFPTKDGPGEWIEVPNADIPIELCAYGFHGWLTLEIAKYFDPSERNLIYEAEIEGDIVKDYEKAAGRRCRLLRVRQDDNNDDYWKERLDSAKTIIERLQVYKEAEKAFIRQTKTGSYNPLVPALHGEFKVWIGNPTRCGTCGLSEMWHEGGEIREELLKNLPPEGMAYNFITKSYNWELLETIRLLRQGMPLE